MTRRQKMKDRTRELLKTLRSSRLVVFTMRLEGFSPVQLRYVERWLAQEGL